jgi:hypothetical protein
MTTRADDWQTRLNTWATNVYGTPFDWKRANCGFFVADAAVAMGLPDPARKFRRWSVARLKVLSARGLIDAVPYPEQPIAMARRGDCVAYNSDGDEPALAVCMGKYSIGFSATTQTVVTIPTLRAVKSFRVG